MKYLTTIYRKFNGIRKLALLGLISVFSVYQANAQCNITYTGSPCVGEGITFFCNSIGGSGYNWDFNAEGTNTTNCNPSFIFNTAGPKTIKLNMTTAGGAPCTSTIVVDIKNKPKVNFSLITNPINCFQGNSFCFVDSSSSGEPGGKICKISYIFSDGQLIQVEDRVNGVTTPRTFCKSYTDPSGGTYDVTVEVEDCNGCVSRVKYPAINTVLASMGLSFNSNRPQGCDSVIMTVTNNSVIQLADIDSFLWDFGDGTYNTTNWGIPNMKHTFYKQGPNSGSFNTTLTVWSRFGCKESFTFTASAVNFKLKPVIIATKDSTCITEPEITFSLKDGVIVGGSSPVYNYGDPPTGPLNITRQWVGTHRFSGLGPYRISFSFTHTIPACSGVVYDTILIIGPQSTIEGPPFIADFERFQCLIKDSVHFLNQSKFYHNDNDFSNDNTTTIINPGDSVMVRKSDGVQLNPNVVPFNTTLHYWAYPGFNRPLVHHFAGQTPLPIPPPPPQFRGNSCVERLWDFDDDYCEKCTTDTKKGINIGRNCKYSRDTLPVHWYMPWDQVYKENFSTRVVNVPYFNPILGQCFTKRMFSDDSIVIVADTFLYYGDNALAIKTKDSVIYSSITNKIKVQRGVGGPVRIDATVPIRFYLRPGDTVYIDLNNTFPPNRIISNPPNGRYQTVQPGQSLIIYNTTDSALYNVWLEYSIDTFALNLLQPGQKYSKIEKNPQYVAGDSIDPAAHRQDFFNRRVRCHNVRLSHKDICHDLACEHEAIAQLALQPARATRLRKDGVQCLGGSQSNYGITFILSDTKPGCMMTHAELNYDTALGINNWVPVVGANIFSSPLAIDSSIVLQPGAIIKGNLPPQGFPYGIPIPGYQINGPPPVRYSRQFTINDMADTITGYINVGLIVGNSLNRSVGGTIQRGYCVDTVYYHKFARFPIMDNRFRIHKPTQGDVYTKICRGDTIFMGLDGRNRSYMPDIESARWSMTGANVGKYYNQYYILSVDEYYKRFQKVPGDTTHLINTLEITKTSYFDGSLDTIGTTQKFTTAKIHKWHTEADITPVYDIIKEVLDRNGFDIYEMTPQQISDIIWNGVGTFGDPTTGSRGCLDTTGIGRFIRFYQVADSSEVMHYRDTTLKPVDIHVINGQPIHTYAFVPYYAGYYIANYGLRSIAPENCVMQTGTAKKVIVGFYGVMNYTDTIICHGQEVMATPQFRYFEVYPEITNELLDPLDYWRNPNRTAGINEDFTRWDLAKRDDNPAAPITIFGGFPYSRTGVGNPDIKLSGSTLPGSIYYNDSGNYLIRTAAGDSLGCKDTFPQDVYITKVKAKFSIGQTRPQCRTFVELFDSSKVFDPCVWKLGYPCDKITKWYIHWGDSSNNQLNFFPDALPPRVAHDYTRNGTFKISLRVETELGCWDTFSLMIYIPGPEPAFDINIPLKYCVGDKVIFTNQSKYTLQDTSVWLWDFGDGGFGNQYTEVNPPNDTITHVYKKAGKYQIYLYQYYTLKIGTSYRRCSATFPDTFAGQQAVFEIEVFAHDSAKLLADRTTICPGETVNFTGTIIPGNRYTNYVWSFSDPIPGDTIIRPDTFQSHTYVNTGKYWAFFRGDSSSVPSQDKICPGIDSVLINVDSVVADFEIDSLRKPVFCFNNTSQNASSYRWGLFHKNDIVNSAPNELIVTSTSSDNPYCEDLRDSLGLYWVCLEATNVTGCKDTVCKILYNNFQALVRPPNVFTPKGKKPDAFALTDEDQLVGNNVFNIIMKGESYYSLKIYDRWGVLVFESEDKNFDWDGTVKNKGRLCPDGTYFYILRYRYEGLDKDEPVLNGVVQLMREN